jgi:hypothetical protein
VPAAAAAARQTVPRAVSGRVRQSTGSRDATGHARAPRCCTAQLVALSLSSGALSLSSGARSRLNGARSRLSGARSLGRIGARNRSFQRLLEGLRIHSLHCRDRREPSGGGAAASGRRQQR